MDDKIQAPVHANAEHGPDDDFVQAKLSNDPTSITHFKESEHGLSTLKALKIHYKAVGWAFFFGMSVIGWGYDASVGGTLLGSPQFRKDFGYVDNTGQYILPARWQSAFNSVTSVGMIFGAMACGYVADHIGRRGAMACACVVTIGAIFLQFFAKTNGVLLAGKIINGLSLGFYWVVAPSYCSEIVPLVLRGAATSGVNLFIALGQLLASGMINAFGARTDSWAYRAPFALQWIFPVILLVGLPFCPESPWYLMRRGRRDAARRVLERLSVHQVDDMEGTLNHMAMTIQVEERMAQNASFAQCFRGVDRRRTLIALGSFTVTQLVGVSFVLGYCTYFFQLAGIKVQDSFKLGLGVSGLGILGNIGSWFICNRYGRRTAYVTGTIALTIDLFLIGILDVVPGYPPGDRWAQAVMTLLYNFIYFFLVGGMAYIIFAEVSSTALKSKTIGLTIAWTNVLSTVINIIIPYMLNPDDGNWRGKAGFFFGGLGLCCSIWAYFFLPETNGRTYDELDIMFHRRVNARDFAKYKIEAEQ